MSCKITCCRFPYILGPSSWYMTEYSYVFRQIGVDGIVARILPEAIYGTQTRTAPHDGAAVTSRSAPIQRLVLPLLWPTAPRGSKHQPRRRRNHLAPSQSEMFQAFLQVSVIQSTKPGWTPCGLRKVAESVVRGFMKMCLKGVLLTVGLGLQVSKRPHANWRACLDFWFSKIRAP